MRPRNAKIGESRRTNLRLCHCNCTGQHLTEKHTSRQNPCKLLGTPCPASLPSQFQSPPSWDSSQIGLTFTRPTLSATFTCHHVTSILLHSWFPLPLCLSVSRVPIQCSPALGKEKIRRLQVAVKNMFLLERVVIVANKQISDSP